MQSLFFLPLFSAQPAQPTSLSLSFFSSPTAQTPPLAGPPFLSREAQPDAPSLSFLCRRQAGPACRGRLPRVSDTDSRSPAAARHAPSEPCGLGPHAKDALLHPYLRRRTPLNPIESSRRLLVLGTTIAAAATIVGLAWSYMTPPFLSPSVHFESSRSFALRWRCSPTPSLPPSRSAPPGFCSPELCSAPPPLRACSAASARRADPAIGFATSRARSPSQNQS